MSGCLSSSMTGSTDAGPPQPQEDPAPLPVARPPPSLSEGNGSSARRGGRHRHQPRRRMTSAPPSGQTIQLTPLWEHVVRTRRFPSEVDTQATFVEISERLRDPEWEVRQHALRVLMDVLPTLNTDVVDKVMQPVVPELINNLGHPAPAVRKGALDTLRVYLVHSPNRENMVKNILHDGLNRPDAHNPFQTNVTTGVILSAPLLLFPSSNSPPPTMQILKDATIAFASRLVQVPHQEAVLKSLMKIRDAVGEEEFESYLADYDDKFKKNIDVLSKIYNIKPSRKRQDKNRTQDIMKERAIDKSWDSDSDTSGIAEEEDEMPNAGGAIPPARVVLETEIKFNEETAITMTILEEKDDDSDVTGTNNVNNGVVERSSSAEQRKTPRRVHFGGEIVKLRTPDSDETESIEITPKTRIPLPVSPATKMPETRRRPLSQPSSPHAEKRGSKRASRSASSSPKREYTHNAQLSPKKSILTRPGGPLIVINPVTEEAKKEAKKVRKSGEAIAENETPRVISSSQEVNEVSEKEEVMLVQAAAPPANSENKLAKSNNENDPSVSAQVAPIEASKGEQAMILERDDHANAIDSNKSDVSGGSSRQERNYTTTKSSPEKKKLPRENKDDELERGSLNEQKLSANSLSRRSNSFPFGSPVNNDERINRLIDADFIDEDDDYDDERDVRTFGMTTDDRAVTVVKYGDGKDFVRDEDEGWKERRSQHDRKEGNASEGNESVTCSSSEGEGKPQEPSWEELGLVGQEVLDDLHNKDDWRARVRGLERVASALRTSSALIAIESRLGSLLHAALGGERSCRVAAAGLAVAKVVVAGVSEDALRKKLPQLAWGLARQGGSAAAQLTRIAMLRLKPSLLLEQLMQPHCLSARNAKTRENALQLLIFSLVTFPSTEFKLETVASRVATMVADRRRRVRQAALDALAVLGQIYDPEEVLEAGRRAGDGSPDAEAMLAAIRARLARKSLPLVSADGLVVYGLQISPTVQITTGPDVDWIVAGSGSVSPGTGRSRGQIIATSRSAQGRASRNEFLNNRESLWIDRPNLVALGVGLQSKTEQSTAWQKILPSQIISMSLLLLVKIIGFAMQMSKYQIHNEVGSSGGIIHLFSQASFCISQPYGTFNNENEIKGLNGRNANAGVSSNANLRFEEQLRSFYTPLNQYDFVGTDAKNHREISDNFEQKARNRRDVNETAKEKENTGLRGESRIPVLLPTRERPKITSQNREKSLNLEHVNSNSRKQTTDVLDSNKNRINTRQENVGSYAAIHQRRKRFQQEENQTLNQTFDSHTSSYRPSSYTKALGATNKEYSGAAGNREAIFSDDNSHGYGRFVDTDKFTDENDNSTTGRQRSLSRNMQQQTLVEAYNSIHERQRKLMDRITYRPLRTAPSPSSRVYQDSQNLDSQIPADSARYRSKDRRTKDAAQQRTEMDLISSNSQENGRPSSESFASPHRRRLRSLSPSQLGRSRQFVKLASGRFHAASMYDIDKATTMNEEEYNARNRSHFSPEAKGYHVQGSNKEESRYQEFLRSFSIGVRERPKSASSSSSDVSRNGRPGRRGEGQDATLRDYNGNDNSGSSTPRSRDDQGNPAFDVITQQTANRQSVARDDVDSFFTPLDTKKVEYPIATANALTVDEASKEWSSEDDMKPLGRLGSISRHSNHHDELIAVDENCNRSTESSTGVPEQPEDDRSSARRRSVVLPNERIPSYEDMKTFKESLQSKATISPKKTESLYLSPNHNAHHSPISDSPTKRNSRCGSRNLTEDPRDFISEDRIIASIVPDEDASIRSLDTVGHPPISMIGDSPAIIIASRPHSHETAENARSVENANPRNKISIQESTEEESSVNDNLEDRQSKDSASETNMEPGILKIESEPAEDVESRRRMPSKVPVRGPSRSRIPFSKRTVEKPSEKSKRMVQQCFTQLESKDWEVTMKGLKALSQISKQHPEGLDVCAAGTIGRLLGRHIKNLRSQVARAACLAASDVFSSQIRNIDQDLDDIAGPLLHRTADTNRFLRADSNAALDQMVQYLPPHKIICTIVHRGASHQNSIVRATTARLLSDIIDLIGPDHVMILPRDVRDKLLNTGAKLLTDGNLDARNYAKRMFRRLTRCEGFRKALTEAVPETTLRHIDKTMKTL
ncbi:PREDICTED: uncharacterized protein LOC105458119 [Wasmannia auropunctata]|uniref:uncharacterized protein LOC105458119 n=1 Tax=Wasmannia auropunctata TaxID=64793 RepID=UPI0005EFD0EC|nr:PREDICTED: uncharacterized protein LOC105458119 [Wasmannia auropunctata]